MANKKKAATTVVAVATAAALLLGGTFAWQSISQTALNEASDVINPGGRLHDDFNGSDKNVYVENFAEDEIFARVRFDEYFEIIMNYGGDAEKSEIIVGGDRYDPSTYEKHIFGEDGTNATDDYWDWTMGSADSEPAYYMPTFNLNKDSLAADVNGVFNDANFGITDRDDGDQYEETYKAWTDGDTKEGFEIYDGDTNNVDELSQQYGQLKELTEAVNDIIDNGTGSQYYNADNLALTEEKVAHTAAQVNAETGFISMADWDGTPGAFWVYDTDGWCYWAQPIGKGETTGLLMDGIALDEVMDDTWYYAINVVGQFITANDIGDGTAENPGFMQDGMTDAAKELLRELGVDVDGTGEDGGEELGYIETLPVIDFKDEPTKDDSVTVYRGTTYEFSNNDTAWSGNWQVSARDAKFTSDGNDHTSTVSTHPEYGTLLLHIAADEPNDTLLCTVTFSGDGGEDCYASIYFNVKDPATPDSDKTLQEAFNNGGKIDLGDKEIDAAGAEPIANVSADFFWNEGGTLNGGVINGTPSTAEDDGDSYTTLFINNEKDWPEEGDDANHATMNDTVVNSESDFVVYIQTVDAGATLNGVNINGEFGGLLAEYNTDDQYRVNLNDVTIKAESNHKTDWVNTAVAAAHNAIIDINSGTYTGKYAAYVFSSGGTINIYDGYFDGALRADAGEINIYGGTFTVDPSEYVAEDWDLEVVDNGDGTYTVRGKNADGDYEYEQDSIGDLDVRNTASMDVYRGTQYTITNAYDDAADLDYVDMSSADGDHLSSVSYDGDEIIITVHPDEPNDTLTLTYGFYYDDEYELTMTLTVLNSETGGDDWMPKFTEDSNAAIESFTKYTDLVPSATAYANYLYFAAGTHANEGPDPENITVQIFDKNGTPITLEESVGKVAGDHQVQASAIAPVPEGTKAGDKFTGVATWEVNDVTYGIAKEYYWVD